VLQGAELECIIPIAGPGVVRLGRDQVAAGDQFVALDRGIIVDGPLVILEDFRGVLDTNRKTASCLPPDWCRQARRKVTRDDCPCCIIPILPIGTGRRGRPRSVAGFVLLWHKARIVSAGTKSIESGGEVWYTGTRRQIHSYSDFFYFHSFSTSLSLLLHYTSKRRNTTKFLGSCRRPTGLALGCFVGHLGVKLPPQMAPAPRVIATEEEVR
jgi:hypothetical protein